MLLQLNICNAFIVVKGNQVEHIDEKVIETLQGDFDNLCHDQSKIELIISEANKNLPNREDLKP